MLIFISLSAFSMLLWIHLRNTYLKPKFYSASFLIQPQNTKLFAHRLALKQLNWPLFLLRAMLLFLLLLGLSHLGSSSTQAKHTSAGISSIIFKAIKQNRSLEGLEISLVLEKSMRTDQELALTLLLQLEDLQGKLKQSFDLSYIDHGLQSQNQSSKHITSQLFIPQKQLHFSSFQAIKASIVLKSKSKEITHFPLCIPATLPVIKAHPQLQPWIELQEQLLKGEGLLDQSQEQGDVIWEIMSQDQALEDQSHLIYSPLWLPFSSQHFLFDHGHEDVQAMPQKESRILRQGHYPISELWLKHWKKQRLGIPFLWAKAEQEISPLASYGIDQGNPWRSLGFKLHDISDPILQLSLYLEQFKEDQSLLSRCQNISLPVEHQLSLPKSITQQPFELELTDDAQGNKKLEGLPIKLSHLIDHMGFYRFTLKAQPETEQKTSKDLSQVQMAYLAVQPKENQAFPLSIEEKNSEALIPNMMSLWDLHDPQPSFDDLHAWHCQLLPLILILALLQGFWQKKWLLCFSLLVLTLAFYQNQIQLRPIYFYFRGTDDPAIKQEQAWKNKLLSYQMDVNLITATEELPHIKNIAGQAPATVLTDQIIDDPSLEQYLIPKPKKAKLFELIDLQQIQDPLNQECLLVLRLKNRLPFLINSQSPTLSISYTGYQQSIPFSALEQPLLLSCQHLKIGEHITLQIKSLFTEEDLSRYEAQSPWVLGRFQNQQLQIPFKIKENAQSLALAYGGNAAQYAKEAGFSIDHVEDILSPPQISPSIKSIFLDQVQGDQFNRIQVQKLEAWVKNGGILWVSGDQNHFSQGKIRGSELERILPILAEARPEKQAAKLSILIDHSGSMSIEAGGIGLIKLQERIKELIELLSPNDQIEIIAFAGDAQKILPPTKLEYIKQIPLPSLTQGSSFLIPALSLLQSQRFETEKHICVIFSDGILSDQISIPEGIALLKNKFPKTQFLSVQTNINTGVIDSQKYPLGKLFFDFQALIEPKKMDTAQSQLKSQLQMISFDAFEPRQLIQFLNQTPPSNELKAEPTKAWLSAELGDVPSFKNADATHLKKGATAWLLQNRYPILASHQLGLGQVWVMSASDIQLNPTQWQTLLSQALQTNPGFELEQRDQILWILGENIPKQIQVTSPQFNQELPAIKAYHLNPQLAYLDLNDILNRFDQELPQQFLLELSTLRSNIWIQNPSLKESALKSAPSVKKLDFMPQAHVFEMLKAKLSRWQIPDAVWILLILFLLYESANLQIQSLYKRAISKKGQAPQAL